MGMERMRRWPCEEGDWQSGKPQIRFSQIKEVHSEGNGKGEVREVGCAWTGMRTRIM